MNKKEFAEVIKLVTVDQTIEEVKDILLNPPGRSPARAVVDLSNWYKAQSDEA